MLTAAVYVTGSTALESGRRYILATYGTRLRVLGPVDVDPSAIVLDHAIAGLDATASEGRLVVSGTTGRAALVLVFMAIAGTTPDLVAKAIVDASEAAGKAPA